MIGLPEVHDEAIWAADAIGDRRTDRYARDIVGDADDYVSNPDWGSSLSIVALDDADRVALTILDAMDSVPRHYEKGSFVEGPEDWARCEVEPEEWADAMWVVVYCDNRGFGYPDFYATEEEARAVYEVRAADSEFAYDEDEEDLEDISTPECRLHGIEGCTAPECIGVLLSEVKDAELWGGTE